MKKIMNASKTQMMSMLSFFFALLDNHYYPRALVGIDTFAKCERNFTKRDKFGQFWGLSWAKAGNFKAKLSIVQCKNLSLDYENSTAFASVLQWLQSNWFSLLVTLIAPFYAWHFPKCFDFCLSFCAVFMHFPQWNVQTFITLCRAHLPLCLCAGVCVRHLLSHQQNP